MSNKKVNTASNETISSALKPEKPAQEGKFCHESSVSSHLLTLMNLFCAEIEQEALEMLASQQKMEESDMHRLCSIIIVDLNGKEIHLKVRGNSIDLLHRQYINCLYQVLTFLFNDADGDVRNGV